jgi:fatty-acyl-CoA synthase
MTPDRTALTGAAGSVTFAQLDARTGALAASLRRWGVGHGDRVAYLGPNHPAFLESLFAVGHLGAVFVPLNTRLAAAEIAYMLGDCGASVLLYDPGLAATARTAAARVPAVRRQVLLPAADGSPMAAGADEDDGDDGEPVPYEAVLATAAGRRVTTAVTLDDPFMILYTSGTTGRPKGAVLTHGNVTWNMVNQLAHVDVLSTDVALAVAPLFHTAGLNQVTLPTLFKGGEVVVLPRVDPAAILAAVELRRVTSFAAVPTILEMICEHPDWERRDVSSLRVVVYGGAPVAERVARRWLARGVPLVQGYGLTETSPGVYLALPDGAAARPTSVGVPHFFTDVALLVDGQPTAPTGPNGSAHDTADPPGRVGEVLVRGPNVFRGYWQRPADTRQTFVEGWFATGDIARVAPDGWAYVVDRAKDMIISGGENVYPAEVEAALLTHPGVAACGVVGVPDARWGEVPVAFVVPRAADAPPDGPDPLGADGPGPLGADALTDHLRPLLAAYKIPSRFRFVADLPRTAAGKVRRADLRAAARAARSERDT